VRVLVTTAAGTVVVAFAFWLSTVVMSPAPFVVLPLVGFALGRSAGAIGVAQTVLAFYLGLALLIMMQSRPTLSDVWNAASVLRLLIFITPYALAAIVPAIVGLIIRRRSYPSTVRA